MEDIIEKIEENKIEIKSVSEYITEVSKIKTSYNIFYRGHPNEEFELEPSIYRKKSSGEYLYIDNEDKIYREMIAKAPNDFSGKNTIESLVLMQHYGIPTRLLDLTTNPLVALYFACSENNKSNSKKNGEVLIFDIPNESVCYSDSDRVTILANLAKCDKEFYYNYTQELLYDFRELISLLEGKKEKNDIAKFIVENNRSFPDNSKIIDYVNSKKEDLEKYLIEKEFRIKDTIDKEIQNWINEYGQLSDDYYKYDLKNRLINELQNLIKNGCIPQNIRDLNNKYFGRLLHFIREDKSYFLPIIDPKDLGSTLAIRPKLDNPRIIRQYGAFLIFGIGETPLITLPTNKKTKPMIIIESNWIKRGKKDNSEKRIIIDASSKIKILKELETLGISAATLFPEIDKIADEIKKKFKS